MDFYIVEVVVVIIVVVIELEENLRLLKRNMHNIYVYIIYVDSFQLSSDYIFFYVKVKHKFSLKAAKLNVLGIYSLHMNIVIYYISKYVKT